MAPHNDRSATHRVKVAVAGGTGTLGGFIVDALLQSGRYDTTILLRAGSRSPPLSSGNAVEVDYHSDESLHRALQKHQVLVSALGKGALELQPQLIKAAVAAGVKRIIPSEFGSNLRNSKTRQFPTYRSKVLVEELLEQLQIQHGISYTLIYTNCLLDWGMSGRNGILLDPMDRSIRIYDGGSRLFSTTSMNTAGQAVVAVLDRYAETSNRAVYIHDAVITQNDLISMAKEITAGDSGSEWRVDPVDTAEAEAEAYKALKDPANIGKAFYGFAVRGAFGEGYGGYFEKNDNKLLGIKELERNQIKEVVRKAILAGHADS